MFPAPLLLLAAILQTSPEIPLTPAVANASPYREYLSSVAAGDDSALVVWSDTRGIRAARIDRDGRALDARPIAISDSSTVAHVTRAGDRWFAVWADTAITGRFIDDDGNVSAPITIAARPQTVDAIQVAFAATGFVVAWKSNFVLDAVRLDANGQPAGAPFNVHNGPFLGPEAVAVGGGTALVWAAGGNLHALHIDANGNQTRTVTDTDVHFGPLHAVADGGELAMLWILPKESGYDTVIAREGETPHVVRNGHDIPHDLVRIGGTLYAVFGTAAGIELVAEDGATAVRETLFGGTVLATSFGDRALFAFIVEPPDQYSSDIHTLVADERLQGAEQLLAVDAAVQKHPAIARGANGESLAVWIEVAGGAEANSLMALRLDAAGRAIGAPVKLDALNWPELAVHVASDGNDYLVLRENRQETWTRRVLRDGTPAGEAVKIERPSSQNRCLAWTGTEYVAGYIELTLIAHRITWGNVRVLSVSRDGTHGSDVQISDTISNPNSVACAAGETSTLLMWNHMDNNTLPLDAALRTHAGAVSPIPLTLEGRIPSVAANGGSFAAAWETFPLYPMVQRALVTEQGTVSLVNELPLFGVAPGDITAPVRVAPFGSGYLLVWGTREMRALALTSDGRSAGEIAVARDADEPVIAGGDVPLVLYTRGDRLFTRTISTAPQPLRRRGVRH